MLSIPPNTPERKGIHRHNMMAIMDNVKNSEIKGAAKTVAIIPTGAKEPKREIEIGAPNTCAPVDADKEPASFGGKTVE